MGWLFKYKIDYDFENWLVTLFEVGFDIDDANYCNTDHNCGGYVLSEMHNLI